jgi:uncharacterized protein YjdB
LKNHVIWQRFIITAIILILLPWGWSGHAAADTISRLVLSTNAATMEVGDTYTMTATAIYVSGLTTDVTIDTDWSSQDPTIATVYTGTISAKAQGSDLITASYNGKTVVVNVTVNKKIRSLTKNKTSESMRVGQTDQITLMATYTDGTTANVTNKADEWSSSNDSVATVTDGLITGVGTGNAIITAKYGTQVATISVDIDKVLRLDLVQNNIAQTNTSLKVGTHSQFQLMALFDNGDYEDISSKATWSSDTDSIAYAYKGLITAYNSGETTITASYGTKSVKLVVDVDVTKRLVADPTEIFMHVNKTAPIALTAFYADGSKEDVTTKAKWDSDNYEVATVANGIVTAFSNGKASISASYGGKTTTVAVDVDMARKLELDSSIIQLSANKNSSTNKKTATLTATYADGTVEDVTYRAAWSSDNEAVAIVNKGNISAITSGEAVITAAFGLNSTKLVVDVDVAKSLTLNKTSLSLRSGKSESLVLTATLADGSALDVTDKADWSVDNESVAYVVNGNITAVSTGQAVITAKYGAKTATITVQVEMPTRLEVDKTDLFLNVNDKHQAQLLSYFSGSNDAVDVTQQAEWSSANESVVSVSGGLITGISMGQATITGKYGGKTVSVTVDLATPRKLSADQSILDLRSGVTVQSVITATYANGGTSDVTGIVTWSSDNADVASVNMGSITANKVGHANITAAYGGKTVAIVVNVDQPTILSANIQTLQLQAGDTNQIILTGTYGDKSTDNSISDKAVWKTSNAAIADVKNGLIVAIDTGAATITASYGDRTVTIKVMIGEVSTLTVNSAKVVLKAGETFSATLSALFKDGTQKPVTGEAVWTSSSDKIAKVNGGIIKAVDTGKAIITVSYGGQTETIEVQVDTAAKLSLNSKLVVMNNNATVQLVLTATHTDLTTEDVTSKADWKTSSDSVADVSAGGLITSYSYGKAKITATYGGKSLTVPVEVNVASKLYFTKKSLTLKSGQQQKLVLMAVFSDKSERDVTADAEWSTSAYKIADVDNGTVTAIAFGKATITAKYNGKQVTIPVVVDELKYLKVSVKKLSLKVGESKQVNAIATYTDGSTGDVTTQALWTSPKELIAEAQDGMIIANGTGTVMITCKFAGKTTTLQVTVN